MPANGKIRSIAACAFAMALGLRGATLALAPPQAPCVDYSKDPAGCQPSTFKTPMAQMPSARVNREGKVDPTSSEQDARAGVALLEKRLHLFRNFEHLHWVPLVPSVKDPATGAWKGGDLDGAGDGRSFAISGNCIFVGHRSEAGANHAMNILKIQPKPDKQAPAIVGEIPTPVLTSRPARGRGRGAAGERGNIDDKEARSLVYKTSRGEERQLLVRLVEGVLETYRIDTNTCLPIAKASTHEYAGGPHEFFLWHDPTNAQRVLIYVSMTSAGVQDPDQPGTMLQDAVVFALTDENTGELLPALQVLAGFSLPDVGGPRANERPDDTGLFADGRFADFSQLKNRGGVPAEYSPSEGNHLHSLTVSDDGERVYVAGGPAGFYVLNSEAIAHHRDVDLAAGAAGCHLRSTVVSTNGAIDASKLTQIAGDCLHMVVNDDPGLKAYLGFASPDAKILRYLTLLTRSRFDVHPPINTSTGIHSAVIVPNRPSLVRGNTKSRPAYVVLTDENFGCPSTYGRIMSVDVETTPMMIGAFAIPDNRLEECLDQPITEPNGQPRPQRFQRLEQMVHNPTVFKDLIFVGWYAHGVRVIDISNPMMPREVGHALPVPLGGARGYPVFKDGLMYWIDTRNGLQVARYTGPWSDEVPGPGSGVYDSNSTSPHR